VATIFTNARLIDGTGVDPLFPASVVVQGGRIAQVSADLVEGAGGEIIDLEGRTLLPGLIDSHLHLSSSGDPNVLKQLRTGIPFSTVQAVVNAGRLLRRGVTAVRDAGAAGGVALGVKHAVAEGLIQGPRIVASGRALSITGGHGDPANGYPPDIIFAHRRVVDSPDEARKAAREELAQGADCIKMCATGGVMSPGTVNTARGLTEQEMQAAIEEAHNVGKKTLAHAQGTNGIKNAIRAGVDSIEHGFWLDDEAIEMMLDRGVCLVPTLVAVYNILEHAAGHGIPEHAVDKARLGHEAHLRSFSAAYEAGVKIAMGTDAGTPFNYHGNSAFEIELMVRAGMTPMDAIVASTKNGAELLQLQSGTIEPGRLADMLIIDGDPLADITCLQAQPHMVVLGGEIVVDHR